MKNVIVPIDLNKITFFCVGKVCNCWYDIISHQSENLLSLQIPEFFITNKALIWAIKSHHGLPIQQDA